MVYGRCLGGTVLLMIFILCLFEMGPDVIPGYWPVGLKKKGPKKAELILCSCHLDVTTS